jgi:hypothetical protein
LNGEERTSSDRESHIAVTEWNEGSAELHKSGLRKMEIDGELRRLQLKYARAYSELHHHERDCEICQFASRIARPYSASHSKIFDQLSSLVEVL